MTATVVSLLPVRLEREIERLMAGDFTGHIEIHMVDGVMKAYKVNPIAVKLAD